MSIEHGFDLRACFVICFARLTLFSSILWETFFHRPLGGVLCRDEWFRSQWTEQSIKLCVDIFLGCGVLRDHSWICGCESLWREAPGAVNFGKEGWSNPARHPPRVQPRLHDPQNYGAIEVSLEYERPPSDWTFFFQFCDRLDGYNALQKGDFLCTRLGYGLECKRQAATNREQWTAKALCPFSKLVLIRFAKRHRSTNK